MASRSCRMQIDQLIWSLCLAISIWSSCLCEYDFQLFIFNFFYDFELLQITWKSKIFLTYFLGLFLELFQL